MNDQKLERVREDLRYVRDVVGRHGDSPVPIYSRIMWSVYCVVGFIWLDVRPQSGANFLLLGGLGCAVLEFVFAAVFGHRKGERNRGQDQRELFQLLAFVLAAAAVTVLMARGHFTRGYSPGQMFLVLLGYHFITAGVQFPAKLQLRWNTAVILGLCLLIGAILISFFPNGVWSVLGVVLGVVIACGFEFPRMHRGTPVNEV